MPSLTLYQRVSFSTLSTGQNKFMDLAKHAEGLDIRPNNVMAKTARLKLWLQIAQLKVWQDGMVSLAYAWWANVWMWIYALHAPGKKMKKKQTWSFHTHLLTPFSNTWHIHNAALAIVPFSWPTTICDAFTALYVCELKLQ